VVEVLLAAVMEIRFPGRQTLTMFGASPEQAEEFCQQNRLQHDSEFGKHVVIFVDKESQDLFGLMNEAVPQKNN
jgi:hypothetical protein